MTSLLRRIVWLLFVLFDASCVLIFGVIAAREKQLDAALISVFGLSLIVAAYVATQAVDKLLSIKGGWFSMLEKEVEEIDRHHEVVQAQISKGARRT